MLFFDVTMLSFASEKADTRMSSEENLTLLISQGYD